jgi:hypothetical protein
MLVKSKTYRCLSPVGIQDAIQLSPLSKRLDQLDGKRIFFSIGGAGDPDVTLAMTKELPHRYPGVKWTIKAGQLTEDQMNTHDAMVRAVLF